MSFLVKLGLGIVLIGVLLYVFGLPPQVKRKLERGALQAMGENKASYVVKNQINKIPDSNDRNLDQLKRDASDGIAGLTRNGVGEAAGEIADTFATKLRAR